MEIAGLHATLRACSFPTNQAIGSVAFQNLWIEESRLETILLVHSGADSPGPLLSTWEIRGKLFT